MNTFEVDNQVNNDNCEVILDSGGLSPILCNVLKKKILEIL